MLYLLINICVLSIPLAFSWRGERFASRWSSFIPACLIACIVFVAWDILFARLGIWGFNRDHIIGTHILGLPLEEWLFFVCVPYACVFTYYTLREARFGKRLYALAPLFSGLLLTLTFVLAFSYQDQLYTFTTCVLLGGFLLALLVARPPWAGPLWVAFAVLLIPFVATNGLLTGLHFWDYPLINLDPTSISDQVVWYDNAHNIGVRVTSIPVDDFLYAFLLIGLNVALFEQFSKPLAGRKSTHH